MVSTGFDGLVGEADYSRSWNIGAQDGVDAAASWKVTQGTGRQISCAAQSGFAFAKGVLSRASAAITAAIATPTQGQFFLIVRRIDWSANTAETVAALAGPTTPTTVAPTACPTDYSGVAGLNTTAGSAYDQPLAWAWSNSANTNLVVFDLRRIPGSPADLAELATWGGPEAEFKTVREGGAIFERTAGTWVQRTPARFPDAASRDTAYAKASSAYLVAGAQVRLDSNAVTYEYGNTNSSGLGWLPQMLRIIPAAGTLGQPDAVITDIWQTGNRVSGIIQVTRPGYNWSQSAANVGVMPAGSRPAAAVSFLGMFIAGGTSTPLGFIGFLTDGSIQAYIQSSSTSLSGNQPITATFSYRVA